MARTRRRSTASVIARLFDDPRRFDFFQAVRVLERQAARQRRDPRFRARRPVGLNYAPGDEAVRFHVDPHLTYPGNPLVTAKPEADGRPPVLGAAFIGLTGPMGVLPQHYSELVIAQGRQRSTALGRFLDLMNHRAISLFYRAWVKYRPAMAFETTEGDTGGPTTGVLAALTGFGTAGLRDRLTVSDHLIWHFSGLLSAAQRSSVGLEALLSEVLRRPVTVESFVGGWLPVAPDSQSRLPSFVQPEGQYNLLGIDTVAGARSWDAQGRFRLKIGPLDYARFRDFMPGGGEMARLADLVRLYAGPEFDVDVQVTLAAAAVPQMRLAEPDDAAHAPRLGWNTWLTADESPVDRHDALFRLSGLDDAGDVFNEQDKQGTS